MEDSSGNLNSVQQKESVTSAKLRKSSKPTFTIPRSRSEVEHADTSANDNDDSQNDGNVKKRKNKNLIKLKKYKKRQLKKKYSRKQLHARKLLQQSEVQKKSMDDAQEEALNYLRMWHDDYNSWKFKTLEQSWLIKNALNKKMLPSSEFKMFKKYIKKLVGRARDDLLRRCSETVGDTVANPNEESNKCINDGQNNMETSEQQQHDTPTHHQEAGPKMSKSRAKKLLTILSVNSD